MSAVSRYGRIVTERHHDEGDLIGDQRYLGIPVINAGDGDHQHTTQAMTDLMTIRTGMVRLDNTTIGVCGDLKLPAKNYSEWLKTVSSMLSIMVQPLWTLPVRAIMKRESPA
jgi:Aspartate carbamoyltransferase, catalytic chain